MLAMLQQVFVSYPRAHSLIQTYVEGVGIDGTYSNVRGTSGYEALRILAKEFSLRSRAEASFFRADFVKKSYKGDTQATYISDAVRKMDVDLSRYRKLIDTLPHTVSRDGLEIQSADLTLILIRSLPREAQSYVMRHAQGESYHELRNAALRFEGQQRLFSELGVGSRQDRVNTMYPLTEPAYDRWSEWDGQAWEADLAQAGDETAEAGINAVKTTDKCNKCGKAGHSRDCQTDMSAVKCFKRGEKGHIGANCPKKGPSPKANAKARPKGKGSKGKGKGNKGKKGKLNTVGEGEENETGEDIGLRKRMKQRVNHFR